jgi:two-component system, NarL family, sensor kinase
MILSGCFWHQLFPFHIFPVILSETVIPPAMLKIVVPFLLSFLLAFHIAYTQTGTIEKLKHSFTMAATPAQKLTAALAVCGQSHSLSTDTLSYYALLSKKLAIETGNREQEIVANTYIENSLIRLTLFDSAINMCNNDLPHLAYTNFPDAYARTMKEKCYCLMESNRNRAALALAFPFLAETEKYQDTVSEIYIKTLIGIVYRNMEQTELAMQWFMKADAVAPDAGYEKIKNEIGVYFLIGMMYNWRLYAATDPRMRLQDSLQCIRYLDRSIADSRRFDNLLILAKALNVKAATIGNKATAAIEGKYVKEASAIYSQLHDTLSMLNSISPMCFYYIDEGHPEQGVAACLEGIKIASHDQNYPIIDLYEALSQCYKAAGNRDKYEETLNTIIAVEDSVYKVNTEKDLAELNAQYEDQQKENIIIRQQLDLASKKYSVLLFSILTLILLAGIISLYWYFYQKQKKMKTEQRQAVANAEEAERKRISADLHDNIGAYAAAAASTISYIQANNDQSIHRLDLLRHNVQSIVTQLNDSVWALNKQDMLLTTVSDRFKIFVQKLQPSYPAISIRLYEKMEEDPHLSAVQALHLFRMMQEALNNALRHSKCTVISVTIQSDKKEISISITDNGTGMTPGDKQGNGLNNLKTRSAELGWTATWADNEGGGTSVIIQSSIKSNTAN